MTKPAKLPVPGSASAGGFLLAAALIVGTIVGLVIGQPTIGFLGGLGVGVAISLLIWLFGR